ncbi:uncharacterized protein TNCV_349051 [Trichonephila clavipes]|nr:uncharacterized protein TNCV_349051 [Trichonephila clavipes]
MINKGSYICIWPWIAKWLEPRTPDRMAWVRCLRVHTEYVLVKSVGPKVLGAESRVQGTEEYFPPAPWQNCQVEIDGVAIYRPFGEFRRASSNCHLLWCSRSRPTISVLLAPCHYIFRWPRSNYVRQIIEPSGLMQSLLLGRLERNDLQKFIWAAENSLRGVEHM